MIVKSGFKNSSLGGETFFSGSEWAYGENHPNLVMMEECGELPIGASHQLELVDLPNKMFMTRLAIHYLPVVPEVTRWVIQ